MGLFDWLNDSSKADGFFMDGKGPLKPIEFGSSCVQWATRSSSSDIQSLSETLRTVTGQKPSEIEKILSEKRDFVQLYLIALQSAAYFLYLIHQKIPQEVLQGVRDGIGNGFLTLSKLVAEDYAYINSFLVGQFQADLQSLNEEISSDNDDNNFLSSGKTAAMVTELIAKDCNFYDLFQQSSTGAIERMMIEKIVSTSGILFLIDICPKLKITYRS